MNVFSLSTKKQEAHKTSNPKPCRVFLFGKRSTSFMNASCLSIVTDRKKEK